MLERFNEIIPDGAHRIMAMAEEQQTHRIRLERDVIGSDLVMARYGMAEATLLCVALIALAFYVASLGNTVAAAGIVSATVASVAATFLRATQSRRDERQGRWAKLMQAITGAQHEQRR